MKRLKLFLLACALMISAIANAQTDVTSTYITNAGFDESGDFQTANVATGGSNQRKAVTGWTNTGGDTYTTGAAIGFGTSGQINGANLPSTNSDGTATGGALCLNAAWTSQVWYAQEVTFPAGNYTMTFKVNNVGQNASFEKDPVMFSFTTNDGSSFSGNVHSYPANTWTTQTITFALATETTGTIKIGYKATNTGSGNTPKLVVDYVKAMYNSNYTATLQSAIDRATILNARASDSDLAAAITTAQDVLDAADNTVAYQATINSAVTTLRSAISTAAAKVVLLEGENVTFMFENADFESGTPVTVGITTYDYDAATNGTHYSRMQVVEGWTIAANGNAKSAGIYQFGQNPFLGSTGASYQAPSSGSATGEEKALGIVAVWQSSAQYKQDCTLPAGSYIIEVPIYNTAGTTAFTKNLIGFVENGGTEHLATANTYATGSWITEKVIFELENETAGYLSLGYTAANAGSSNMPHLFIDGVKVTYTSPIAAAYQKYQDALTAAQAAIANSDYDNVTGSERTDLQSAIDATPATTKEGYNDAADALDAARETFTSAKANYDAFVAAKATVVPDLTYAAAAKKTTLEEAVAATASNSAEAATKAAAITTALRAYYESHALAEGVDGAVNYNSAVAAANAGTNTGWTNGVGTNTGQGYTDSEGTTASTYLDGGWNASAACNIDMTRTVEIPAGTYLLTVKARGAQDLTVYTLSIAGETINLPHANGGSNGVFGNGWEDASVEFESDGTAQTLEVIARSEANQQWFSMNDFRLVQLEVNIALHKQAWEEAKAAAEAAVANSDYDNVIGSERTALNTEIAKAEPSTADGYDDAAAALISTTSAFTAAKANYDANAAEVTKATALGVASATISTYTAGSSTTAATALTNTQNLKVAEYNYVTETYEYGVDLGTWTTTGPTGSLSDQHYKGSGNSYLEQSSAAWGQNSWTIKYAQDLTLPAGNYVFKVAGRQAASDGVTLSLTVKNGETVLGTVNDFPRGDTGLGINTSGATDFTTGEGHEYVNSGNGRGWEWRYVKFTLAADATVNVSVDAVATTNHMWVSFCDATVQTDNEANTSLIAYNIALADAQSTLDNQTYKYVGGTDRSNLSDAIAADEDLDKTDADAIDAATTALNTAKETFTAGVASWNAYVFAKNTDYADDQPYASAEKYAAIATAQAATATSASDATTKTNAIISAYRQYVESNALAEGVSGAENKTSLISDPNMEVTYDGTAHTFGAWQVFGQTDGTIQLLSGESFTDGSGKNDYKYADIYKSDNNAGIKQTINLESGKYLLTATARAANTSGATFGLFAGTSRTEISRIGNSGGVFDRGWNDASVEFYVTETSDVEIGVQSGNGKDLWWSATRFRLVKLPTCILSGSEESAPEAQSSVNVILNRTLSSSYWSTFSVPFNTVIPSGWTVKEYDSENSVDNVIAFKDATTIEAGKPYLVKPASNVVNPTFDNVTVESTEGVTMGEGDYKFAAQIYNKELATDGTIAYLSTASDDDGQIIKKLTSGGIKGLRAYFIVPASGVGARIHFMEENETTGIESIDNGQLIMDNGAVYDLQGRKVQNPKRGMYIINGKKVIVK